MRRSNSKRSALDACVGYLNLRGWDTLASAVGELAGREGRPPTRLLVGMAARPEQMMRQTYRIRGEDEDDRITQRDVPRLRDETLRDFRDQLTVGAPTNAQEQSLRAFRSQLIEGKVRVKFFARYPLHAKLYLAHLADGQVLPHLGIVGSSNLTLSACPAKGS